MIYYAIVGINSNEKLSAPAVFNMYKADEETLKNYKTLPETLIKAKQKAAASEFIKTHLPKAIISAYTK